MGCTSEKRFCRRTHIPSPATTPPCRQPGAPSLRPRPGALIASIAGTPVSHLDLPAVTALLDELTAESSSGTSPPSPFYDDGHGRAPAPAGRKKVAAGWTQAVLPRSSARGGAAPVGQRRRPRRQRHQLLPSSSDGRGGRSGAGGGRGGRGDVIRVVLREVEVHAWPPNWRHEVGKNTVVLLLLVDCIWCRGTILPPHACVFHLSSILSRLAHNTLQHESPFHQQSALQQ